MNNTIEKGNKKPILAVAPMEGVMDHTMRELLSEVGGMDYFVSEFVRVTQYPIPASTFKRLIPENTNQAQTKNNHPVHTQLLGSNPELMAQSALSATEAGATHIDINFGCPAKRVNGHGGGSILLQTPETLHNILLAIRSTIPSKIPLSAKIRLGYEDESLLFDNVAAIEDAGATTLTIHGRTKRDGYSPPARWEKIGTIQNNTNMTIVANGDIIDSTSLAKCKSITGCNHFMIGRGSLNNPFVFREIETSSTSHTNNNSKLSELIETYTGKLRLNYDEVATLGRIKQWCGHLRTQNPLIKEHLQELRRCKSTTEITGKLHHILNK